MLITAIAIKLCDHGPVLYKQVRLTKDGRKFEILNLRWMEKQYMVHKEIDCIQTIICAIWWAYSVKKISDMTFKLRAEAGE